MTTNASVRKLPDCHISETASQPGTGWHLSLPSAGSAHAPAGGRECTALPPALQTVTDTRSPLPLQVCVEATASGRRSEAGKMFVCSNKAASLAATDWLNGTADVVNRGFCRAGWQNGDSHRAQVLLSIPRVGAGCPSIRKRALFRGSPTRTLPPPQLEEA